MHRLALLAVVAILWSPATRQTPQPRPLQADGIVRLLADLEAALGSASEADLDAIAAPDLPQADRSLFRRAVAGGQVASATVRERARRPVTGGVEVLTEVLVSHGRRGRIATWQINVRPDADEPERYALTGLSELASLEGLVKLALDTTKEFALRDFTFRAPDFVLEMSSGTAFVADSGTGVTALVIRGRGSVRFSPPHEAEQGQLRIFADKPVYTSDVDGVFIRLNPSEFESRVAGASLVAQPAVDPDELRRAQEIFDEMAPRTYNLDLRDLGQESWSLEPSVGSVVVEFRSRNDDWLTYAQSPSEPEDISFFDRARGRNISVYASPAKLADRGPFFSEDDDRPYDLEHVGLDLTVDPDRLWISGRGVMRVRVMRPQINTLTFKLAEPFTISSVTSPTFGRLLTLRIRGQNKVIVSFPRPQSAGTVFDLDVAYSGRVAPQRLDREAIAVDAQGQGVNPQDPFAEPLVVPEPRFLYSNRVAWYPQNEISDYATAVMRLTVPSEYQVVASGTFVSSTMSEVPAAETGARGTPFRRTVEYQADRPSRYAAMVISRFVPIERRRVDVPAVAPAPGATEAPPPVVTVEVVSTPRMTGRNRQMPDRVAAVIGFYAKTLGEAPYPDFTLAALDDNLPGGHSPAYFAVLHQPLPTTPYQWTNDPVSFEQVYPHFFLAHEVAHQWWGQAIGWKNYHEQWLSEGFAQYFAALYGGADRGPDVLTGLLGRMRDSAMAGLDNGPIYLGYRLGHLRNDGRIFRATVYNKSAVVLHMLRRLIGDEAFFAGVRDFYTTWRFKKAGTGDLKASFGRHTTMPLDRFFERWVLGASIPRVRVNTKIGEAGRTATVRVEQLGDVFDLPLSVLVRFEDGGTEPRELKITEQVSEHVLAFDRPVRRVDVRDELTLVKIER